MANDYFTASGWPSTGSAGASAPGRAEFNLLVAALDKLAPLTGNGDKAVVINAGGTAQTVVATTGTGNIVRATSPALVTPNIGAATATSINKVAVTAPATSATLTIADGKTLTASNTLTLGGTDGTTMTFPSASATIARTDAANTFTGVQSMTSPAITTSLTTPSTTFALINTTATTVNFAGGASTALNIGHASGTNTLSGLLSLVQGQIQFPATQNASANANTLDDYEEGEFTISLLSGGNQVGRTYVSQIGRYTKIGRIVHFAVKISLSAVGSSTGDTTFSGLPFTSANIVGGLFTAVSIIADDLAVGATTAVGAYVNNNASDGTIGLYSAGQFTTLQETNLTASTSFFIAGSYIV